MPARLHGRHLRAGRFSQAGQIYLLTAVTRGREPFTSSKRCLGCLGAITFPRRIRTRGAQGGEGFTLSYVVTAFC